MNDQMIWKEEREHLASTTKQMQEEILEIDHRFTTGVAAASSAAEESLRRLDSDRYKEIMRALDSPYFARIDFTATGDELSKIYIGKTAVYDCNNNSLVTDWRAPVSSLYYDGSAGRVKYSSPKGTIRGDLTLKRSIRIIDGKIKEIEDVVTIGKDGTRRVLEKGKVSDPTKEAKTATTLLNKGNIDVSTIDNMLISSLSELADTRLKSIVATIQAEQNKVIRADMNMHHIVQGSAGSGKTSVALHRVAFLAYELGKNFRPENFLILTNNKLLLNYISNMLPDLGVERVPQHSLEELVKRITGLSFKLNEAESHSRYKSTFDILSDIDDFLIEEPKHSEGKQTTLSIFSSFLKYIGHEVGKKYTPKSEDLIPILYLHARVKGIPDLPVKHIIIDEAQDFSIMQLTVLQNIFRKSKFTIFGDLAQSINPRGANSSWEEVNQAVWNGDATILHLEKSYRSTIEIMEAAGNLLDKLDNVPRGVAVIRHGEPVTYSNVFTEVERATTCIKLIERRISQGLKSIAVIVSYASYCGDFLELIDKYSIAASLPKIASITVMDEQYNGGICLLEAALSKGLEFDAVIVADAERYQQNVAGTKLQYVSMTRAIHTLDVVKRVPRRPGGRF